MDVQEIRNNTDRDNVMDYVAGVNPVSLKMNSIQCLLVNTVKAAPSSLFGICVDYMSWNPQIKYQGSMTLPQCMHTKTKMMELQWHPPQEVNTRKSKSSQVTLYGNVTVDLDVKQYLLNQAAIRKYSVVLHKLTSEWIKDWQPPARERWEDIDPYSSLEEILSNEGNETPSSSMNSTVPDKSTAPYSLQECKTVGRSSTHPLHNAAKNITYNITVLLPWLAVNLWYHQKSHINYQQ